VLTGVFGDVRGVLRDCDKQSLRFISWFVLIVWLGVVYTPAYTHKILLRLSQRLSFFDEELFPFQLSALRLVCDWYAGVCLT
jgi:hypothetical protein